MERVWKWDNENKRCEKRKRASKSFINVIIIVRIRNFSLISLENIFEGGRKGIIMVLVTEMRTEFGG